MESSRAQKVRAPSIRDVAKLAGVSHQTVSRVLNDSESIRDATRDRVLEAMKELHYRPNRAARALVTSRSRTLGVLASNRTQYGPSATIQAVEEAALARGYFVTTANLTDASTEGIRTALTHLRNQDMEGLVVIAPQQRVFDVIEELGIEVPYVTLHSSSTSDAKATWVDQIAGARMATSHLLDLGHRGIRHLAGPQDWIEADARMQGFLLEMSDRDMAVTAPIKGDWTAEFGYQAGLELLRWRDCTAIFAANDLMALGVQHAARSMGLQVPRDVSVVGYDDIPEAAHFSPPLTTVHQDFARLGSQCIEMLLDEDDDAGPADIVPELRIRESTAPPRAVD
jgi:DNA-binding LacI/PurR family transcriptional regulator